jgi:hypothetical protein
MHDLWLLQYDPCDLRIVEIAASIVEQSPGALRWHAIEQPLRHLYVPAGGTNPPRVDTAAGDWTQLKCVQSLEGPASGRTARRHYVAATDVVPGSENDLDAWYQQEHLPGLAAVPGTVRAARYLDPAGSPRSYACYDLVDGSPLEHPAWLAVRATAWSSRVRPLFRNTRRTMFETMGHAPVR